MQTHAEVTVRLGGPVNQLPIEDQLHLTFVVEQLATDPSD
jgi:hypothetical protein